MDSIEGKHDSIVVYFKQAPFILFAIAINYCVY